MTRPNTRDQAEEAIEQEQEHGDGEQTADRGLLGLLQRVLAERRRDVGALDRHEVDGQRAGLQHEREVLRLGEAAEPGDLRAVRALDPVRVLLVVDRRERADLPVEHDREVLQRRPSRDRRLEATALRLGGGDLLERLRAAALELHEHDRALVRVGVGARAGKLQILARHLRDRVRRIGRLVLEEVPVALHRVRLVDARADDRRAAAARDDGRRVGDGEDLVLRLLRVQDLGVDGELLRLACAEQRLARGCRSRDELLRLHVEEGVGRGALRLGEGLHARQQVVEPGGRDHVALRGLRRAGRVGLHVVELERGGLADQRRGLLDVVHAGELDDDLILALGADLGLGDAELVDAVPHDLDRPLEVGRRQRMPLGRLRPQHDLEAALEVEAERRLLVAGRAGHADVRHAREGERDQSEQEEVLAPF